METVTCLSCATPNNADADTCARCGEPLAAAKVQQATERLRALTARIERQSAPSFSTINGFGTTLLDYRPRGDGTYDTVRWVVAAMVPLVPLGGYVIRPVAQENSYGRQTSTFSVVGRAPLEPMRVVRTYLLVFVGLFPVVWGFLNTRTVNRVFGSGPAFFVMLVAIAWAIYFVFVKVKNEGDAYKPKPAAEGA